LAITENLPIKPISLDFAYMVTVLEFLSDPLKALKSIWDILKVNSSLVILLINKESSWGKKYSEQAKLGDPIFSHSRLYSLKEVFVMLKNSNYVPEELVGTVTSPPDKLGKKVELVEASSDTGVILIKGRKS
jgi:ubiquinone/menaquinone biosynthesis C-methylase UbiE